MEDEGIATAAQLWDAGNKKTGPVWDEAVARMTEGRGLGTIASLLLGLGFKPRHAWETQIDLALQAEREFYAHAETAYDLSTDEGQAAYREAQQRIYEYYPFLSYVRLVRRGEMERDRAYAWEVLNRIPPGSIGYSIKERVGMTDKTVDLFYQSVGHFDDWSDIDRANFMAKVEALGVILGVPDTTRRNEWDTARKLYGEVKADLRAQFGDDIFDIQNLYFDVQDMAGRDAAQVILDQNPQLAEMWDIRSRAIAADDSLMAYWGSLDMLDRLADNLRYDELERRWPDYQEINAGYFKDFPREQWKEQRAYRREYLGANSWLKDAWDLNDALRNDMEAMVENLVAKMKPPLGPVVRPDTDLASVLTQEAQKLIEYKYQAEEWIKGPRPIGFTEPQPSVPLITGDFITNLLSIGGVFTPEALQYFKNEIEVRFDAEEKRKGAGGYYTPEQSLVALFTQEPSTAIHELAHAWWEKERQDKEKATRFVRAVARLAEEKPGRLLVNPYKTTTRDPRFLFVDGFYWNDHDLFAYMAGDSLGDISKIPQPLREFYAGLLSGKGFSEPVPEAPMPSPGSALSQLIETVRKASEGLDIKAEPVVQSRKAAGGSRGAVSGSTAVSPQAATSGKFSWQVLKGELGEDLTMKLVGHLLQGFPLSAELRTRLEAIHQEYPLGLTELEEWIDFVRTLWRASIASGSSRSMGKGLPYRPRPLLGTSQPGAGRRFTPWG